MNEYEDRFGVSDSSAPTLAIMANRGNDVVRTIELVSRHIQPNGTYIEAPLDITADTLESGIYDARGSKVSQFALTKAGTAGVINLFLAGNVTAGLELGTYNYYFDTVDAAGIRQTRLKGKLEILPK